MPAASAILGHFQALNRSLQRINLGPSVRAAGFPALSAQAQSLYCLSELVKPGICLRLAGGLLLLLEQVQAGLNLPAQLQDLPAVRLLPAADLLAEDLQLPVQGAAEVGEGLHMHGMCEAVHVHCM